MGVKVGDRVVLENPLSGEEIRNLNGRIPGSMIFAGEVAEVAGINKDHVLVRVPLDDSFLGVENTTNSKERNALLNWPKHALKEMVNEEEK